MGIGKFLDPRNMRSMIDIAKISDSLGKHMMKRCAYCDMDMGMGNEVAIVDFVDHLADKHLDKIEASDIESYRKLIKRFG